MFRLATARLLNPSAYTKQSCLTAKRFASSGNKSSSSAGNPFLFYGLPAASLLVGFLMLRKNAEPDAKVPPLPKGQSATAQGVDYNAVAKDVADLLESNADYDGIGHYGPVLVRLAWHSAGTYDVNTKTGGSDGATMRFDPEASHGANGGLKIARDLLEPVKAKYPGLSYGDLWTLAGVVAIKEMGGPSIAWRAGRVDAADGSKCPPDGRLPDASKKADHVRQVFYKMGFNDQEIVALSGAHALGKCHPDRSGFKGPWTFSPVSFTNAYFAELLNQKWVPKKKDRVVDKSGKEVEVSWKGPAQYVDAATGTLMMLETDLALIKDSEFKKYVDVYAKDQEKFFQDFTAAFGKLIELGCSDKVLSAKPVTI